MPITVDDLQDQEKALVWVAGAMEQLAKWNLIQIDAVFDPKHASLWDQLDAGWKPGSSEILHVLLEIMVNAENLGLINQLLLDYRDKREEMAKYFESESVN